METFINKLVKLVDQSKGWLQSLGIPVIVVAALFFTVMFAISSDQNKGKYKIGLIVTVIATVIFAAVVYVIPWFYTYFS
ncbi:hypothetical protein G7059_03690 [Erysipelothrix sp. HDW6A]|uniref:hypothetical protein n=1 Tax=Erysipelothrix sp. HDW6A TaxID=2714928 RepID=UPI00140D1986|nr:hypothetical protein [Erysipelothrix sp. HDW6A]QIK57014.1 hypothetical protein G7059_03690 [Erysipelothrix sp. HDW6A]